MDVSSVQKINENSILSHYLSALFSDLSYCPAKILRVEESPNAFGEAVTERRERMSNKSKVMKTAVDSGGLIIDSREEERRCMRNRIVVEVEV